MSIKKTPYVEWLKKQTDNDPTELENLLVHEVYINKNEQALSLMEEAYLIEGDTTFSMKTFKKAAELVISI